MNVVSPAGSSDVYCVNGGNLENIVEYVSSEAGACVDNEDSSIGKLFNDEEANGFCEDVREGTGGSVGRGVEIPEEVKDEVDNGCQSVADGDKPHTDDVFGESTEEAEGFPSPVGMVDGKHDLPRCCIGGLHWQRPNRLGIRKSQCVSLSQRRQCASL